jgi:hypothetical protein
MHFIRIARPATSVRSHQSIECPAAAGMRSEDHTRDRQWRTAATLLGEPL